MPTSEARSERQICRLAQLLTAVRGVLCQNQVVETESPGSGAKRPAREISQAAAQHSRDNADCVGVGVPFCAQKGIPEAGVRCGGAIRNASINRPSSALHRRGRQVHADQVSRRTPAPHRQAVMATGCEVSAGRPHHHQDGLRSPAIPERGCTVIASRKRRKENRTLLDAYDRFRDERLDVSRNFLENLRTTLKHFHNANGGGLPAFQSHPR